MEQILLLTLAGAMMYFEMALWQTHWMNGLICAQSSKPIANILYPDIWRYINRFLMVASIFLSASIALMVLVKGLIILFGIFVTGATISNIWMHFYRWKPIEKEMMKYAEHIKYQN